MPLITLFPVLGLITGRMWTYAVLIGLVGSFAGGWYVANKFHAAEQLRAVNVARVAERDAVTLGNEHERGYLSRMREKQEKANAKIAKLQKRLRAVPSCPVPIPAEWLRQPAPSVPAPARDAAGTGSTGKAVDTAPVADAKDVVLTCERNRLEVSEPNAEQLTAVQQWYRDLRERLNRER